MLIFFFFNDTATTEIYTLSLHDALPIFGRQFYRGGRRGRRGEAEAWGRTVACHGARPTCRFSSAPSAVKLLPFRRALLGRDRKSTRLNSSHVRISYAVFCFATKTSQTVD